MTSTAATNKKDEYESERELRISEQKALDKFFAGSGCCLICFVSNPLVLEEHHPAGRKHSPFTLTLCANHHALLSRRQRSWPAEWQRRDLSPSRRAALMLRGLSEVLLLASEETWTQGDDG